MSDFYQVKLLPSNDHAYRPPRYDLTPDDLIEAGWIVQPYFETGRWVARQAMPKGGAYYTVACQSLERLYLVVRHIHINKIPWDYATMGSLAD